MTSFHSVMSKARFVPGALDLTYQAAIRTVILVVGFVLLFAAGKAVFGDHVVIEPISVPKKLEDDGYSGTVVSRLLLDEVQAIRQSVDMPYVRSRDQDDVGVSTSDKDAKVSFQSEDDFAAMATIQVPSSSLSLRSITVMLRDFLGIPERKIGGAITVRRPYGPDKPVVYRVALLLGPSASLAAKPEENANLEQAIRLSARSIARQYDPVGLAIYYLESADLAAMKQLADDLMQSRDSQLRKQGLFIRGLYEQNLLEKASFFQEATEEDPTFSDAYNGWGTALFNAGNVDEAIAKYGEAIKLNPLNSSAYRNRAIAYKKKGEFQRAIEDFARAGKLNPRADTFFQLGYTYEFLPEFDAALAVKAYDQAINLDATYPWALNNRCYVKAILGDPSAIADCNKALRQMQNFETYDSRGFAYLKLNQLDNAIADYDTALTKFQVSQGFEAYSLYGRGIAKLRKGDVAGGNADIAAALERDRDMAGKMAKMGVKK
jgi:tetratricopeptide (TPR) repeat protein